MLVKLFSAVMIVNPPLYQTIRGISPSPVPLPQLYTGFDEGNNICVVFKRPLTRSAPKVAS